VIKNHNGYGDKMKEKTRIKYLFVDIGGVPLNEFVDFFISSCYVHLRKPDADIFRLALDTAQAPARQVVYIENTPMFVKIAEGLGIRSVLHTNYESTCAELPLFGLEVAE
jgi:FMN phosphatase YigB (HAD superfamily)